MDSIDRDILRYCAERDNYYEVKDYISKSLCVKDSWMILNDFGEYYKEHPDEQSITSDFKVWWRVQRHPEWKPEKVLQFSGLIDSILEAPMPERDTFRESLYHLRAVEYYKGISDLLARGSISVDDAESRTRTFLHGKPDAAVKAELSLEHLADEERDGGFYFRCEDLNKALGQLRKGDFVVVAKRPEVGGTSFLVSELSYMLEQTDGNAVIFNNEEEPSKVFSRMVSSALGVNYRTLLSDPKRYDKEFREWLGTSNWDLIHDTSMTISSIHKVLEEKEYDLIGINVLLKVGGTGAKEDHDKFQALGEECRRIAQKYGPVIAIVQADPSAEGMQYIPQDRIYKSKTALQGEADALIMIGTDEDIQDGVRYIHVAKNKLPPSPTTINSCKHIKSQVNFDMDTGRFTTANVHWAINSREINNE